MSVWKSNIVGHDKVDPGQLVANPRNFRMHPKAQRAALAASITELGFIRSVTVNKRTGNVVDGHERIWQALTSEQPTIDVEYVDLSEEDEKKALAYMDPISEMATVDAGKLDDLLREVQTGDEWLAKMLDDLARKYGCEWSKNGDVVEDDVPEPPFDPITKPGDLWLLGDHRLLCGDSTNGEDVGRLLGGHKPFIMITDPPYGVEYDPKWRNDAAKRGLISFAGRREGNVTNDDRIDWSSSYKAFSGAVAYVWHAGRHATTVCRNLEESGFEMRTQIIWKKPTFAISRGHYHWQHEPCWYAVRGGTSAKWRGDRSQSTIWEISNHTKRGDNTNHGTQKPVECMARPIRNHGDKDDVIYDPFVGSGTTISAAEQLGRRCLAMEIEPIYCDVSIQRWEKLTGKKAICQQVGQ